MSFRSARPNGQKHGLPARLGAILRLGRGSGTRSIHCFSDFPNISHHNQSTRLAGSSNYADSE